MARIAVGGFMHESNSFVPGVTDFAQYAFDTSDRPPLSRGQEVLDRLTGVASSMAGFIEVAAPRHELVPTVWGSTLAGPPVTAHAYERIVCELVGRLSQALPCDAVYLDLHGAMVSEAFEDGEGELLRRVRYAVGDSVPVVISLDYHCNFTAAMAAHTDAVCAYQTYPHIDQVDTGRRAAVALERLLDTGVRTYSALRKMPFLLPLNFQCTMVQPTKGVVEKVAAARSEEVLTAAYLAGFPPADLAECGPAVVVHGFRPAQVARAADDLARHIESLEPKFAEPLFSPSGAVAQAQRIVMDPGYTGKPVIIADTQDNPGAGGSGDTTGLLAALVEADARNAVVGVLCDPAAAAAAHSAGVGAMIDIALGGATPCEGVVPYGATFRVVALGDGRYVADAPGAEGRQIDIGPSAVLSVGGVEVVVSSRRLQARERGFLRHFGIDPNTRRIIVLKSTCHFRADFEPIAEAVLIAISPGGHIADPACYPYQRLRRGVRLQPLGKSFEPAGST